jgi:FkbM family methyltransferase
VYEKIEEYATYFRRPGKMVTTLFSAYRFLRFHGPIKFVSTAIRVLVSEAQVFALETKIRIRGASRIVELDHCRFALAELPNTAMKLELLSGKYEKPEREAVLHYLQPHWSVIELGGCIGVVACITNKLLENPANHLVLEVNPLVLPFLESNRDANGCAFQIMDKALAYGSETVTFEPLSDFWGNSLYHAGGQPPVTVETTTLANLLQGRHFDNFALICDIEGQEYELISREPETIRKAELIVLEVHPHIIGNEKVEFLLSTLKDLGFRILSHSKNVISFRKSA